MKLRPPIRFQTKPLNAGLFAQIKTPLNLPLGQRGTKSQSKDIVFVHRAVLTPSNRKPEDMDLASSNSPSIPLRFHSKRRGAWINHAITC